MEAKRREATAARKAHALQQGQQPALAKGAAFQGGADWELSAEPGDADVLEDD